MRKIAFGYSTRCNIKCGHCVAAGETPLHNKMELARAKEIIEEMAQAGVSGISFTAGEPFIYFDDLLELVSLCQEKNIYTRIVTNSFWAKTPEKTQELLGNLKDHSIEQLLVRSENHPLYNCIRRMGITNIASFAGMKARGIVTYRKCELCKRLFDSLESVEKLSRAAGSELPRWSR